MPHVVTWNTQGDPRNNVGKQAELNALLAANEFVLLQEAGALADEDDYTTGGVTYTVYGLPQGGAFNNRCGTAILTARAVSWFRYQSLVNSNGRYGMYLLDTLGNTVIGTMHANSAPNAPADRTAFLNHIYGDVGQAANVIVGADYNVAPPASPLNTGTALRRKDWVVRATGVNTHFGVVNSELDYFLTRNVAQIAIAADVGVAGSAGSDHKWVRFTY